MDRCQLSDDLSVRIAFLQEFDGQFTDNHGIQLSFGSVAQTLPIVTRQVRPVDLVVADLMQCSRERQRQVLVIPDIDLNAKCRFDGVRMKEVFNAAF